MSGWNAQYRDPALIPAKILRMMPPEERKRLGKGALLPEEKQAKEKAKSERDLQNQIASLLRLRNITFNWSRMDRRVTCTVGWPDFSFPYHGRFVGLEVKLPGLEPTPEQLSILGNLRKLGAFIRVVHSLDELRAALAELDESPMITGSEPITKTP